MVSFRITGFPFSCFAGAFCPERHIFSFITGSKDRRCFPWTLKIMNLYSFIHIFCKNSPEQSRGLLQNTAAAPLIEITYFLYSSMPVMSVSTSCFALPCLWRTSSRRLWSLRRIPRMLSRAWSTCVWDCRMFSSTVA